MNNPTITDATNKIIGEVEGIKDANIKLMMGHADEYYMNGDYEGEDDKFVWYQVPSKRTHIRTEKVIAKFNNYEDAEKYMVELLESLTKEKENGNQYIGQLMVI